MRGMVDVMHKEEEEKLMQFKERIDDKKIPHMLINESISHGLNKAKVDKKPLRHRLIFGIAAILILLVGCVATFWVVNPELLNDNKGLKDAINHEYYQEINVSENIDGMEVTFNGAIVDEKSFVLFYDIRTNEKFLEVDMNDLEVTDEQGNEIDWSSFSYGTPNYTEKGAKQFDGKIEMSSTEKLPTFDFIATFTLKGKPVDGVFNNHENTFKIPFSLDKKQIASKKVYEIGDTIEVEGQKVTFEQVEIYPIRAELFIHIDENNTKELLDFPDLKIVDERGEEWGKIVNGVTATFPEDKEQIIYLLSNYFKEPAELYVVLSDIQAIDKTEQDVVVDLEKEEIVQQPISKKLISFKVNGNGLDFQLQHDEVFPFGTFTTVKDETGNELDVISSSYSQREDGVAEFSVQVKHLSEQSGLLYLPLHYYPEWISTTEEIKIRIK